MTIQYYGKNRGAQNNASPAITTGTSSTAKAMELAVDLSAGVTRKDVYLFLEELEDYLLNERTTPFAQ